MRVSHAVQTVQEKSKSVAVILDLGGRLDDLICSVEDAVLVGEMIAVTVRKRDVAELKSDDKAGASKCLEAESVTVNQRTSEPMNQWNQWNQ